MPRRSTRSSISACVKARCRGRAPGTWAGQTDLCFDVARPSLARPGASGPRCARRAPVSRAHSPGRHLRACRTTPRPWTHLPAPAQVASASCPSRSPGDAAPNPRYTARLVPSGPSRAAPTCPAGCGAATCAEEPRRRVAEQAPRRPAPRSASAVAPLRSGDASVQNLPERGSPERLETTEGKSSSCVLRPSTVA